MFHLHKDMKMRILSYLLVFSMILTAISPGIVAHADETTVSSNETTTWNFRGGQEGAYSDTIEGKMGEFNGILIDASQGKLASRSSGDTQMNAGTELAVPVSGSAIVAVKTYSGTYDLTINGEAATSSNFEYTYTGEAGYVTIKANSQVYLHEVSCTPKEIEAPVVPELPADTSKIDVWDFGAESLDESKYNNKLTADIINNEIFSGTTPGSTGVNLASFSLNNNEFLFNDGGFPKTHRLRTKNTELTRYDEKALTGEDGATYNGYIYSNKGSSKDVYLGVYLYEHDILTLVVASNGNNSTINVESESGKVAQDVHKNGGSTVTEMTFYAAEEGLYKIYSSDEKLVVARVYREHTNSVEVTGTVTAPEGLNNYAITFKNKQTGEVISADVVNGSYSVTLNEKYDYEIALENANGYVISSANFLSIALGDGDIVFDVDVEAVELVTLAGNITGLSDEALSNLKLSFTSDNIYIPELTILDKGAYTLQLEKGVEYSITVDGVNDYNLAGNGKISATESKDYNFEFVEKDKYSVNVKLVGIDENAKNSGKITFTNINEEGYSYTFKLSDENIKLRDGQYSIDVTGIGAYPVAMTLSPDVKVNKASANATVNFSNLTSWDFGDLNKAYGGQGIESIDGKNYYYGLKISDTGVAENKNYLLMKAGGDVVVPVKANDVVTINYCYSAAFKINDGSIVTVDEKSGSTGQIDSISYTVKEGEDTITISCFTGTNASETYLAGITVTTPVEHKDVLTVGATGCDYETINEALDAVKEMNRPNNERVTIEIQPGNYEEMLVVDVPNVTLKNASSNPSIKLINKGVDIEPEAVRITSYYGHGYSYYSMGTDGKYDETALEVNKANGYLSYHNPGSGTTNGSYWNATVVVMADGFNAEGIIFENSFNQYISEKEANDIVVLETGNKGERSKVVGDTAVQDKSFVERAAALAIANDVQKASFDNCRFVGRQDTLYGGENVTASFYKSAIMGGTDYIFGGMTAVFYKCDLVLNTSENSNDVAYITAAQQKSGRGYLMYNCTVTSTTPGVDTASANTSKPGYFGRPWQANTSEVVFYKTIIETTKFSGSLQSIIVPEGWNATLGGQSSFMYEYGTMESLKGEDNSANRASWSTVLTEAKLSDGTDISTAEKAVSAFLKDWKPFELDATDDVAEIVTPDEPVVEPVIHTWDVTTLDSTGVADKAQLPEGIYANYFKVVGKVTQRVSSSTGNITSIEVDKASTGAIQFTVTGTADVVVEMSSTGGSNTSAVGITDQNGNLVTEKNNITTVSGTSKTTLTYTGLTAGTYSIVSPESAEFNRGARVYTVTVTELAGERPERKDWASVAAPVITGAEVKDGDVVVFFNMEIGYDGADSVTVTMKKGNETITSVNYAKDGSTGFVTFTPSASGDYTFSISAAREENVKTGADYTLADFVLPLTVPYIENATNIGGGFVKVSWKAVKEADSYIVAYKEKGAASYGNEIVVKTNQTVLEGLAIGTTYVISVKAVRGAEQTKAAEMEVLATEEAQREWFFSAFGSGVNTKDNYYTGNANLGSVTVASVNGKGKLVPASTDGVAFYYTKIDPAKENFILKAKVTVDNWTLSNGQEGFGLMAADAVGEHGDASTFWNNSYMTSVTKVEYLWDSENNKVSDAGDKISMKLGVGAQEKIGATAENIANETTVQNFKSSMYTLDTSCAKLGAGTYNIIGNYTNSDAPTGTVDDLVTTLDLTIQRDNTGYRLSYTDADGNTTTKLFYDIERTALTQIDKDNIYVGFFASRNAKITVTDIQLTTSNPETDPPAEEIETTYVTPSYKVISTTATGNADYELVYLGNADGTLTIKDSKGNVIANNEVVTANTLVKKNVVLTKGNNTYTITFTPDKDYKPGEHQKLSNYDPVTFTHTVTYKNYDRKSIYVSPSGKASGDGSKSNPLDIYTAVKYVTPGQKIVLAGGTYSMETPLTVARGVDGTKDAMIYMIADPDATTRPVFNFNKKVTGIVFAGDYWYIQGIDVTNSADGQKGLQLSGSNCVLDDVHAYRNGNTGIQLSRYLTTDTYEDWPANNLILNCTSYANADKGYEDADGFAAKLTIGDGNVFDGCIAYNNADDGWDLFAKVETGPIGKVTIKNSVAYGNGYLPDGTNAGNGNGFKMGGSSITGYHTLINSIAFDNKAKGIDSNSCPDIQVYNSTSFNNESYNVAFYTNDAKNTDFFADGVISFKTKHTDANDNFKLLGSQDLTKVNGTTNYYWNSGKSTNTENVAVSEDWFVSLDTTTKVTRNADGTINMNGLLELTDKAPANAGARMTGTPSKVIEIEEETVKPTSTPSRPTSTPSPTEAPFNPEVPVDVTVYVDANGNVNWNDVNKVINEKLDAFNKTGNAENAKPLSIEIDMRSATVLGKELLETIKGQNVQVSLELEGGITWTINGKELSEDAYKNVDLAVDLNTTIVPNKVISQLVNANDVKTNQISLAHDGEFGFKAALSLDLTKFNNQLVTKDIEKLIAGIYHYDEKTGKLVLQSASKIDKNGRVEFNFTHASEYVVAVSDKLVVDDATLNAVTVNGVGTNKLAKRWKYVGGTTGNMEKLEIVLPTGLQDAVDKGVIDFKATYTTSNSKVATVSKDGIVTAKTPGVVIIKTTLKIDDKTMVYSTKITVKNAFIKFIKSPKTIKVGEKATYQVALYGFKAKDITWLTSKRNIAIVYKNQGKLTAVVSGKTAGKENVLVRVLDKNGKYVYGSAPITVKAK